jgi:hypothetical protein
MGVSYLIIHCFQDLSRNMVRSKCLLSAVPFSQDPVRKGQKKNLWPGLHHGNTSKILEAKQRPKIFDCKANASRPAFWHAFLGTSVSATAL